MTIILLFCSNVFMVFALTFLKETLAWNHVVSFLLLIAAAVVAFAVKPGAAGS